MIKEQCSNNKNHWQGKTFITLGDSITWQDNKAYSQGKIGAIAKGYQTILSKALRFSSYYNAGVSGRPMANGSLNGDGTVITAQGIDYNAYDVCIIAVGTNDFRLDIPLGEYKDIGDYDINTFYGAYQKTLQCILTTNRNITICLFTPLQRNNAGYNTTSRNRSGHTLGDYVKAIKDIGEKYSLPVCDLYTDSGIDESNLSVYTMDGLHPNDIGYERMGACVVAFFLNLK